MAEGCEVGQADIRNSIVGLRCQIGNQVQISNTILMGADYYDPEQLPVNTIPLGVGENCELMGQSSIKTLVSPRGRYPLLP
jgi:glucose-1-phosphate adenylyltransferase